MQNQKINIEEFVSEVTENIPENLEENDVKHIELEHKKEQVRSTRIHNDSDLQDMQQRKEFAEKIYQLVLGYMYFVGFIIFLSAMPNSFFISETVIITLLGTTASTVIGLFYFVAKYLFSR